jgi:hypothetical protein
VLENVLELKKSFFFRSRSNPITLESWLSHVQIYEDFVHERAQSSVAYLVHNFIHSLLMISQEAAYY